MKSSRTARAERRACDSRQAEVRARVAGLIRDEQEPAEAEDLLDLLDTYLLEDQLADAPAPADIEVHVQALCRRLGLTRSSASRDASAQPGQRASVAEFGVKPLQALRDSSP